MSEKFILAMYDKRKTVKMRIRKINVSQMAAQSLSECKVAFSKAPKALRFVVVAVVLPTIIGCNHTVIRTKAFEAWVVDAETGKRRNHQVDMCKLRQACFDGDKNWIIL